MRARIKLHRDGEQFVLRLTPNQYALMLRVVHAYLGSTRPPTTTRLLVGAEKERVLAIVDRLDVDESGRPAPASFSLDELHLLHTRLACACLAATSEEAFYIRNGFFVENVRAVAHGLADAVQAIDDPGQT